MPAAQWIAIRRRVFTAAGFKLAVRLAAGLVAGLAVFIGGIVGGDSGGAHAQTPLPTLPDRVLPPIDAVHPAWQDFEPTFQETVCPFTGTRAYDRSRFRCGYVLVPEDRTVRTSLQIKLSVVQEKATGADAKGAMVYLSGGPGGPSLGAYRLSRHLSGRNAILLEHMDLVFFDQRGVGYSGGDFCRAVPQPYQTGLPTAEAMQRFEDQLQQCFDEARAKGVAVDGYTNWQNALDVRDIRRALGYAEWNVFGISYGTELAQGVMKVDPGGTRAVVLDSVVPAAYATNDLAGMYAAGFRSSLNALEEICAGEAACRLAFPGTAISDRLIAAFQALDADPLTLSDLPPHAAETGTILVDGTVAAGAIFQALYSRQNYGSIAAFIDVLERQDETALHAYVETTGFRLDHAWGRGMQTAINCRAGFREDATAPAPQGGGEPILARYMGTLTAQDVCSAVSSTRPDPTVSDTGSDIPVLVAMGKVDPITPPYLADAVMPRFSQGQRVDVPYTGHGALLTHWRPCGQSVVRDFFLAPSQAVDTSCLRAVPPPDLLIDIRRTDAPLAFARALQSRQYPWSVLAAAVGLAIMIVSFPLGALARRIDGTHSGDYGRARLLVWLGGLAGLGGLALAIRTVLDTATRHTATLPLGVPSTIAVGGWLALAGSLLAALAVVALARSHGTRDRTIGTVIAIVAGAIANLVILWFLFSIDAGPFML